ncbi:MAG: insulinase family protein [Rhodospirillales bacterium]|nr:insulinase family protein [Rhodospirillales bacterium]MCB9996871.1 insulinase family protein [Rhodospirillales bacterium]
MRSVILSIVVFVLSLNPAFALDEGRSKTFNAETFTLENGMRAVVIPNHSVPVVTHMVWYGVGAMDEAPGQSGIAHFVEHLMFKGTEKVPPGEMSKRIRALGGNDNAFTGQDITAYYQSIAVEHLETAMTMEADRMKNLAFPPDHVDSERLVVLEERRQRTENEPTGYFYEQMQTALFPNHPYGNPVIGWLHEMEALTRDNVMDFYKKWYAPNNAILVVSGDITAEKLKPLAEKTYGTIPPQDIPQRTWTKVPPLLATTRLTLHHPTIRQPVVSRMYRVPSTVQNKDDSHALEVLANIMGDGAASRFYKSLVVEQKLAASASFRYSGAALSDSRLTISAAPVDGVSPETLEQAMDKELRRLVKDGVTAQEMSEAKTRMMDSAIFGRDSLTGPAMEFGYALTTGLSMDDVEYWPYDIEKVTLEQVNAAARTYLDPDNYAKRPYVTGYLLPARPAEPAEDAP